jgi:hypothetical protein
MEALGFNLLSIIVKSALYRADKAAVRSVYISLRRASRAFRLLVDHHTRNEFTGPYFNDKLECPRYRPFAQPDQLVCIDASVQRDFGSYKRLCSLVITANATCSDGLDEPPRQPLRSVTVVDEYSVVLYMSILLRCLPPRPDHAHWADRVTILRIESSWINECDELGRLANLRVLAIVGCRCHSTKGLTTLGKLRELTLDALVFYTKRQAGRFFVGPTLPSRASLTLKGIGLVSVSIRRMPVRTIGALTDCPSLLSLTVESPYNDKLWSMATNIEAIGSLTQLTSLRLYNIQHACLGPLTRLTKLRSLALHMCRVASKLPIAIGTLQTLHDVEIKCGGASFTINARSTNWP